MLAGAPQTFVGRIRELTELTAAFEGARSGHSSLALVTGEPGIGKSALSERLCTYAADNGGRVLRGHCYEQESASLPYLPFVEAIRSCLVDNDPDGLSLELGPSSGYIARLVPEAADRLNAAPPPRGSPEDDRWRLLQAVSDLLRSASQARPLALLLEDLHWADSGTLAVLQHLGRNLEGCRLLVVGTYRDTEVDRDHPLTATIAELRRWCRLLRLTLGGLGSNDVQQMLSDCAGREVSQRLAELVRARTEGNPLFVQEVEHGFVDAGMLDEADTVLEDALGGVPVGLREVIRARLSRLSAHCNRMLTAAAILARRFDVDALTATAGEPVEAVLISIEEAVRAGVLRECADTIYYEFTHAFFQQTLYEEIIAPRRRRLRERAAVALEEHYGTRAEAHAAELASLFSDSTEISRQRKAVAYWKKAATQAADVSAWQHAADCYARSISVMDLANDDFGEDRAALLHAQGKFALIATEWRRAWRCLMTALDMYRARQDAAAVAEIVLDCARAQAPKNRLLSLRDEAMAYLDALPPHLQARLISWDLAGRVVRDDQLERRLDRILEDHPDPSVSAGLMIRDMHIAHEEGHSDEVRLRARQAQENYLQAGDVSSAAESLLRVAEAAMADGRLEEFESLSKEYLSFAGRWHLGQHVGFAMQHIAGLALIRGDTARFGQALAEIPADNFVGDIYRAMKAELAGDLDSAVSLLPPVEKAGGAQGYLEIVLGHRTRILLSAGLLDEARREFVAWTRSFHASYQPMIRATEKRAGEMGCASAGDAIATLGSTAIVREAYGRLQQMSWLRFDIYGVSGIDVVRGSLALGLNQLKAAEAHYQQGLEWSQREGCPGEAGRCLLGLAEAALHRGQYMASVDYLDRAIPFFQEHQAKLYLDRVAAKKAEIMTGLASRDAGASGSEAGLDGLTARECEVLRLVAQGLSSRDIADTLVLSVRTVDRHIANIYRKIDASGRVQATAYAFGHGLL